MLRAADYHDLYDWSVKNVAEFWKGVWEFTDIVHSTEFTEIVEDIPMDQIPKWFKGARLNYAENLLRWNDDHVALVCGCGARLRTVWRCCGLGLVSPRLTSSNCSVAYALVLLGVYVLFLSRLPLRKARLQRERLRGAS